MADGTVLVTGATGFIGSVLTRQLVAEDANVRILRRETSSLDLLGSVANEVEHAVGDVTYARSLYDAMRDVDRVFHVAAKVSFAPGDQASLRRVNVEGTANVVNAALEADVDRLVHTSSIAALGRPRTPNSTIDEDTSWQDAPHRTAYARSKRQAEMEVHRGIAEGLEAVFVNPSLVFGVGNAHTNTRRIVDAVRSGWMVAVPPGGTNVVDVRDVAAGHRAAMTNGEPGRRYIIGGDNRSWMDIATTLAKAFDVPRPRYTIPAPLLRASSAAAEAVATLTRSPPLLSRETARTACHTYRFDNTRARTELDCTFRPFSDTAERLAQVLSASKAASA